jgi:hypothetical protein
MLVHKGLFIGRLLFEACLLLQLFYVRLEFVAYDVLAHDLIQKLFLIGL